MKMRAEDVRAAERSLVRKRLVEDPVRWFDELGSCESCRKPGHGKLKGPRNENYGTYCTTCATARLRKAHAIRLAIAKAGA